MVFKRKLLGGSALPRILVVEDEEAHAELIRRAFEDRSDFDLTVVGSLREAREVLKDSPPDLAVVDLVLPDGRGIELLSAESNPEFPAVVMTSHGDERVAVEVMKAGVLDYIVKSRASLSELPRTAERVLREWGYIEERKRAEAALQESEEHFRSLIENVPIAIHELDRKGRLLNVNRAGRQMLGLEAGRRTRCPSLRELAVAEERERVEHQVRMVLGGEPTQFEFRAWIRGEERFLSCGLVPLLDESGQVTRVIGHAMDVTPRHRADRDRERLEEQLRQSQKMEALGEMASGVAHDFNNVLTVIAGHTAFLEVLYQSPGTEKPDEHIAAIRSALERATSLSRQLLAFGRRQVMRPVVLDLNEVVSGVQGMLRPLIGEHIRLVVEPGDDVGRMAADPVQIEQVLMNLAVNSRDAMAGGGTLEIRTESFECDRPTRVGELLLPSGRYTVLIVRDSGCGMSPETQAQVFEPFFTTKPRGKGTGLGLSTVYGIVHQSGGYIGLETAIGEGCTFRIYMPTVDESVIESDEDDSEEIEGGGSETILVAEDDDALRRLVTRVLSALGYRVIAAADGSEAAGLIEADLEKIDLLVTDLVMPGLNGRELAERFSERVESGEVLYMSGYADDTFGPQVSLSSADNFLEKPFSPNELANKVREVLNG